MAIGARFRVLVPVDFSDGSLQALDLGASIARKLDADVAILSVVEPPERDPAFFMSFTNRDCISESLRCRLEDRLRTLVRSVPWSGRAPTVLVRSGAAVDEILGAARAEKANLIVMGTHGRRGLVRALLGSVAEEVIRRGPCPVLVVRERVPHPEQGLPVLVAAAVH
jgi:universal stress protein A